MLTVQVEKLPIVALWRYLQYKRMIAYSREFGVLAVPAEKLVTVRPENFLTVQTENLLAVRPVKNYLQYRLKELLTVPPMKSAYSTTPQIVDSSLRNFSSSTDRKTWLQYGPENLFTVVLTVRPAKIAHSRADSMPGKLAKYSKKDSDRTLKEAVKVQ